MLIITRDFDNSTKDGVEGTALLSCVSCLGKSKKTLAMQMTPKSEFTILSSINGKYINQNLHDIYAFEDNGLDSLLMKAESSTVTEETLNETVSPVLDKENMLDILKQSDYPKILEVFSENAIKNILNYLTNTKNRLYDHVYVYLPLDDEGLYKIVEPYADTEILFVPQKAVNIEKYLTSKTFVVLKDYEPESKYDIQFLKKRNLPVPENYVTEICARSFEEAAQYTIDLFGLQETVEGIIEEWNNMAVEEYSNHVGLLPHALDYLLRLKEHGIKLAVATGLPEKLYIPCLKNNSILELFDALCSTDEVQRGKEYSDVFELAARKLGVAPEHCIVFDDVLPAIKSAKAARMLAGGIYDKYSADQRTEIERIADIYLLDFRQAPIPHKEV